MKRYPNLNSIIKSNSHLSFPAYAQKPHILYHSRINEEPGAKLIVSTQRKTAQVKRWLKNGGRPLIDFHYSPSLLSCLGVKGFPFLNGNDYDFNAKKAINQFRCSM